MKKYLKNIFKNNNLYSDDKNIYLHIGTPKTGTSALQSFLLNNIETLNSQGFDYPVHQVDINNISSGNGQDIIKIINGKNEKKSRKNLEKMLNTCNHTNIILSSENLYRHPEEVYQLFPKAKIIVYFRSQLDFIESSYNQSVKRNNQIHPFFRAVNRVLTQNDDFQSHKMLERWVKVYGLDKISLRVYEKEAFVGGTIFSDFLNAIGLTLNQEYKLPDEPINVSYARDALEYKLLLNNLFNLDVNVSINNKIDQALQKYSQIYFREGGIKYSLYNPKQREEVLNFYESSNRWIAEKILNRSSGILFKEDKMIMETKVYPGLNNEKIIKLTRFVLDMYPETGEYFAQKIKAGINSDKKNVSESAYKLASILTMPRISKILLNKKKNKA